jgi:hypothetical protein
MREYFDQLAHYFWFAFGVSLFGVTFWGLAKAGMARWAPEGFKEAVATAG